MCNLDTAIEDHVAETRNTVKHRAAELSLSDVQQLLAEYRDRQRQLILKRDVRRKLMNDKLQLILEERQKLHQNDKASESTVSWFTPQICFISLIQIRNEHGL